jgi:hypothetical protein
VTALYTTKELEAIADGMGQIGVNKMRKALRWAARTLEAADAAVQAECLRATQASATEREACAKLVESLDCAHRCGVGSEMATAIRARSKT